jgi:hypothetical protein
MQAEPKDSPGAHLCHGRWHFWRSDAGAHYATRSGVLSDDQLYAGYVKTLVADTPDGLIALLRAQPDGHEAADA